MRKKRRIVSDTYEGNIRNVGLVETVKLAAGAVPSIRKINGHALTEDTNVTAQDIFNGQVVAIGANQNLDNYQTPGLYAQDANVNTSAALNYPENNAGSLMVLRGAGVTQVYHTYNSSRIWSRSKYSTGAWTPWAREYNTLNKPSATDVGAYTKGESDNKFQPKGSYTPAGQAYTKAESDARYLQDIRLGAQVLVSGSGNGGKASLTAPSGHMLTAILDGDTSRWPMPDSPDQAYARPIQKLVNGKWITVVQL